MMDANIHTKYLPNDKFITEEIQADLRKLIKTPEQIYIFRTSAGHLDTTDLGFAEFFVHRYSDKIKYNISAGKWYVWNNKVWTEDKPKLHMYVKKCIKDMYRLAIDMTDKKDRDDFLKFCKKCESRICIDNMLNLASREEIISRSESDFDNYPEYLNCNNVLIDFSGNEYEVIKHDPKLLIRQMTNIEYHKEAQCPIFLSLLDTFFNAKKEMIEFIQQAIGYSLTGYTSEDCLFFMYGTGRNGKSTFAEILKLLLGNYYHKLTLNYCFYKKIQM